jgi:hypothetical protein
MRITVLSPWRLSAIAAKPHGTCTLHKRSVAFAFRSMADEAKGCDTQNERRASSTSSGEGLRSLPRALHARMVHDSGGCSAQTSARLVAHPGEA